MPIVELSDPLDRRLDPYRDIRSRNWTEQSGYFIAEGPIVVEELLRSDFDCQSMLIGAKHLGRFSTWSELSDAPIFCLPDSELQRLVGFKFHRGILACGSRRPLRRLGDSGAELDFPAQATLVGLEGVQDPENLGGILRTCAALGIHAVLVGPGCADPFSRRALRVAMGASLQLDMFRAESFAEVLPDLWRQHEIVSFATAFSPGSQPLAQAERRPRTMVLLGNEKLGLSDSTIKKVDHQVCIPMQLGVDSMNVNVVAGIVLHYFCELAPEV
ncbi:MAG: RNA methyltransferase [Planctomycetota bacterium]|nr:RNA methyltransferase [Planctomycetota bacterium]